jgi:hypothetical protein
MPLYDCLASRTLLRESRAKCLCITRPVASIRWSAPHHLLLHSSMINDDGLLIFTEVITYGSAIDRICQVFEAYPSLLSHWGGVGLKVGLVVVPERAMEHIYPAKGEYKCIEDRPQKPQSGEPCPLYRAVRGRGTRKQPCLIPVLSRRPIPHNIHLYLFIHVIENFRLRRASEA